MEIKSMLVEAGIYQDWMEGNEIMETTMQSLERFAALVREDERKEQALQRLSDIHQELDAIEAAVLAEREACAKVCELEGNRIDASWSSCAAAIRERGE